MASPMVAGSAALLCAAFPTKTAAQLKALLTNTATSVCKTSFSKYGQIDLGAAMTYKTPVTSITLTNELIFDARQDGSLAAVTPDDAADKTIEWSSDNPDAATVNQSGVVTAVAEGTAFVALTLANELVRSGERYGIASACIGVQGIALAHRKHRAVAMKISGSVAFVTGGGSGLGAATAPPALARDGARVAVFDRDANKAEAVAGEIGGHSFECDVADAGVAEAAVADAIAALGAPAILVNWCRNWVGFAHCRPRRPDAA